MAQQQLGLVVDPAELNWHEDQRFTGVFAKTLLTATHNPQASAHLIRLPPGTTITPHAHTDEIETAYVVSGRCALALGGQTFTFTAGQIVVIPRGLEHAVHNDGPEPVEILTLFTPPRA